MKKPLLALVILAGMWFIMLPFGSFILDVPLLIILGLIIALICIKLLGSLVTPRLTLWGLSIITLVLFYYASVSLYFNMPYVDWLHEFAALFPLIGESPSGFYFMLTSGMFHVPYVNPADAPFYVHLMSGVFFTSYILWIYIGVRLGRMWFDKKPQRSRRTA